jgi:diguanylate cyclase (GGDEF)-like protein/putative nucleotidyltransferase with HDIG domain
MGGSYMDYHVQKINRDLVIGWLVIVAVLFFSYIGEVIKGERTLPYLIVFTAVTAVPAIICLIIYKKKPDLRSLRYFIVVGYFVMYVFVMMTGSTTMVFSYILPMLSFLVLYHQPKLILYTGAAAMVVNVISIYTKYESGVLTVSNSKDVEIQLALIILCFGGGFVASGLYNDITKENNAYNEALGMKNVQIQKMTLQTIATIANTIDAKDEYTRGHSRRVSEYSVAIARELGMDEKELDGIRSIALLHDIGKIGVPDAVLNKPGKLTSEEYQLMKRHTIIGADILKDIGMLPGIDIGAKYHHERWDGKGYPDGLAGEDIPYIARIIAVADAYDAMTSNRVYRKHLDDGKVLSEIKSGVGTQFDPKASQALIDLLESGRMVRIPLDAEDEPNEMRDVSAIVSRVIEKNEGKFIDELTGKYNRNCGEKLIKAAMEQGRGCFIILDIDGFRKLNDTSGFLTGDAVLKIVADSLEQISHKKLVARVGGDEFCVFIYGLTDESKIRGIADAIMEIIKENSECLGLEEEFTVSMGIEICNKAYNDFSEIYTKADKALYYAKQQGGGGYYFHNKVSGYKESSSNADLQKLVSLIESTDTEKTEEELRTNYPDIVNIYEFIKAQSGKKGHHIRLVLFSLKTIEGTHIELEERDRIMDLLEKAVFTSIRGDDVSTKFSSTQRIVILVDHTGEQADDVTEKIMTEFYKMYDKKEVSISYDTADLGQENSDADEQSSPDEE